MCVRLSLPIDYASRHGFDPSRQQRPASIAKFVSEVKNPVELPQRIEFTSLFAIANNFQSVVSAWRSFNLTRSEAQFHRCILMRAAKSASSRASMNRTYTITVLAGAVELECEELAVPFATAKLRAIERCKARASEGATASIVHDDVGRRVFLFRDSELS